MASFMSFGSTPGFNPAMKRDLTPQSKRYQASFLRGSPYFFSEASFGWTCRESLCLASRSLTIIGKNFWGFHPGPITSEGYFSMSCLSV